jgi:hypothetical protein
MKGFRLRAAAGGVAGTIYRFRVKWIPAGANKSGEAAASLL